MRRFTLALLLVMTIPPAQSQRSQAGPAKTAAPPGAAKVRQFVANFEAGVTKGCIQNPPRDLPNPSRYCACYARALVSQYQPQELVAINNLAAASPENVNTIALMAAPLGRACRAALLQAPAPQPTP